MARVMNFSARGRTRVALTMSQQDQLRLKDSANLIQALTMVTEARDAFLKFADRTQKPAVFATFIHLAHAMDQAGAEICQTMQREGDDDPPRCA
jgi:hypothetical protein